MLHLMTDFPLMFASGVEELRTGGPLHLFHTYAIYMYMYMDTLSLLTSVAMAIAESELMALRLVRITVPLSTPAM